MKESIITKIDKFLVEESLETILESRFGRYSKYVIQDRALPDIRDGLKPVQRRILYAMWKLNLKPTRVYKKSARIVGDVIGKYHPHGDSAIYDAMIRLGQEWKTAYPLVDVHGNKGSIDDDPAAAMRYTEVRLTEAAMYSLENLSFDTVPFVLNFDDSEWEPTVLPAYFPNFLVNGAKGISPGYATDVPPHNVGEVIDALKALIYNPNLEIAQLMTIIKGPDFPTYGTIYGIENIYQMYTEGKGKLLIRATINVVTKNKKQYLHVSDIPFEANKPLIIKKIEEFIISKKISGLKQVRDNSDKKGIAIDIELDTSVSNPNHIIQYLYKYTDLQKNYNANLLAIAERRPKVLNLSSILTLQLEHIRDITERKATFLLTKATNRLEIIHGLIKAISILDKVIRTIRKSKDKNNAIANLMKKFKFTENQATAIVNLRLHRLTSTDIYDLKNEQKNQQNLINHYQKLLTKENYLNKHLYSLLDEIKTKFAVKRKTKIEYNLPDTSFNLKEIMIEEEVGVIVTRKGYLKCFSNYEENKNRIPLIKSGDALLSFELCSSKDTLILLTSKGRYIIIPLYQLTKSKWTSHGEHVNSFTHIDGDEILISAIMVKSFAQVGKTKVITVTKNGMIKATPLVEFETTRIKKPVMCMRLQNNDQMLTAALSTNDKDNFLLVTTKQKAMKIKVKDIPLTSLRAIGNKALKLTNDSLVYASLFNDDLTLFFDSSHYLNISINSIVEKKRSNAPLKMHPKNIHANFIGVFQPAQTAFVTLLNSDNEAMILATSNFKTKIKNKLLKYETKIPLTSDWFLVPASLLVPKTFRTTNNASLAKNNHKVINNSINNELRKILSKKLKLRQGKKLTIEKVKREEVKKIKVNSKAKGLRKLQNGETNKSTKKQPPTVVKKKQVLKTSPSILKAKKKVNQIKQATPKKTSEVISKMKKQPEVTSETLSNMEIMFTRITPKIKKEAPLLKPTKKSASELKTKEKKKTPAVVSSLTKKKTDKQESLPKKPSLKKRQTTKKLKPKSLDQKKKKLVVTPPKKTKPSLTKSKPVSNLAPKEKQKISASVSPITKKKVDKHASLPQKPSLKKSQSTKKLKPKSKPSEKKFIKKSIFDDDEDITVIDFKISDIIGNDDED